MLSAAAPSLESLTAGRAATASDPGAVAAFLRHHPGLHTAQPRVSLLPPASDDRSAVNSKAPSSCSDLQTWTAPPCNRLSMLSETPQAHHWHPDEGVSLTCRDTSDSSGGSRRRWRRFLMGKS